MTRMSYVVLETQHQLKYKYIHSTDSYYYCSSYYYKIAVSVVMTLILLRI